MKDQKNVFILSIFFVTVMLIFGLFGQNTPDQTLQELQERVFLLETKIWEIETDLNETIDILVHMPSLGPPDYDSDWKEILGGEIVTLTHNLSGNPNNYKVELDCLDSKSCIHKRGIGTDSWFMPTSITSNLFEKAWYLQIAGVQWYDLTDKTIKVFRGRNDPTAQRFRIRIWEY
jgi:hypothetical protein